MANENEAEFGNPKDWMLIELSKGFFDKESGNRIKSVRMRESTGIDSSNARADIRVKSDNDLMFGFILIAKSCKMEISEGNYKDVTPEDVKRLYLKDINKLSTAFAKLNTDSEEEAEAFLAKLKIGVQEG